MNQLKAREYLKPLRHPYLSVRIAAAKLAGIDSTKAPEEVPILAWTIYQEWSILNAIEIGLLPDGDETESQLMLAELCRAMVRIIRFGYDISPVLCVIDLLLQAENQSVKNSGDWVLKNLYQAMKPKEKAA